MRAVGSAGVPPFGCRGLVASTGSVSRASAGSAASLMGDGDASGGASGLIDVSDGSIYTEPAGGNGIELRLRFGQCRSVTCCFNMGPCPEVIEKSLVFVLGCL